MDTVLLISMQICCIADLGDRLRGLVNSLEQEKSVPKLSHLKNGNHNNYPKTYYRD